MKHAPLFIVLLLAGVAHAGDAAAPANAPAAPVADKYKLHVSGWSYGRERKTITSSNRVTATLTVKNVSGQAIDGIAVALNYFSGLGEKVIDKSPRQTVGSLKAGESKKINVVGDFIPIFKSYTLTVEYGGGKKEEWRSNSDIADPEPVTGEQLKGAASVALLGQEAGTDRAGRFQGAVHVKNEGNVEAKNVKITVTFYDAKRKQLGQWSGPLGKGTLAGGADEKIQFVAATSPKSYNSFEIRVGHDDAPAEAALAGGEFTSAKDVEFAKFVFKRADPKSKELKVTAQVRNGFDCGVDQVKLNLVFYGPKQKELKPFTYDVPGDLKPGEIRPIEFTISELPPYETFERLVGYNKLDGSAGPKAAPPAAAGAMKFQKTKDIEVIFGDVLVNDDKSVSLVGAMRNGKDIPVKDVVIELTFTMPSGESVKAEKKLSDVAQPNEERNFVARAPGAAGYKTYSFKFNYAPAGAVPEAPPAENPPEKAPEKPSDPLDNAMKAIGRNM